ncbi:hypothetical protein [Neobacillus sp. YIM B06451]|uniref:hypothetical protein n=1 Tax=Neobacillus sp. YIM B06451 TaxID=3070994 RepID=UPI00292CCBAD|nr:hypothetical protein [Neobacillus sp. YIM B06451]
MFSVDGYLNSIKANLEKQTDVLVGNLKTIFTYNFSSEIDLIDFSAFIEPTRFELSIRLFSMDKEANEVFHEGDDLTVFAGSEVLTEVEYFQLNESQLDDFFEFYEQNEEVLNTQEQKVFTDWFNQCWEKAGGDGLKIPAYFVFHDDVKSYDLNNKQWIDDDDKWT